MAVNLEYQGFIELPVRFYPQTGKGTDPFVRMQLKFDDIIIIRPPSDENSSYAIIRVGDFAFEVELTYDQVCEVIVASPAFL